MAPAASKLRAEVVLGALPRRALAQYLRLLQFYPVLTKAASRSAWSGRGGTGSGGRADLDGPEVPQSSARLSGDPAGYIQPILAFKCDRRNP